jgi:hypothetical protein
MRFIILFFLLISMSGYGQLKSYILGVRGDTLNKVDSKGLRQGPWIVSMPSLRGERGYEEEGFYVDDNKEGTWKKFSLEGVKIAEENYHWGKLHGKQQYFTYNGGLLREESWRAMDPAKKYDTLPVYDLVDPTKIKEMAIVKNDGYSVKHGTWTYYDPVEGTVVNTENYWLNKIKTTDDELVASDDIKPLSITNKSKSDTASKKVTKPQAVLDYEKKNSGKKSVKVRDGATGY